MSQTIYFIIKFYNYFLNSEQMIKHDCDFSVQKKKNNTIKNNAE